MRRWLVSTLSIFSIIALVGFALGGCSPIRPESFPLENKSGPLFAVDGLDRYMLEVGDLPVGWITISDEAAGTNEKLASTRKDPSSVLAELQRLGRLGGRFRTFALPGALFGTNEINCTIIVLKNERSAREYLDFARRRDQERVETGEYETIADVSAPPIGDYSIVYYVVNPGEENKVLQTWYQLAFTRGNAAIFIESISGNASGKIDEAISAARTIEKKFAP